MKLFADENIEQPIVEWLRARGHDVAYAAESSRSAPDTEILRLAADDGRIILTSDLDFGELIFHRQLSAAGIVLLRFKGMTFSEKISTFERLWPHVESQCERHFVVISNTRIRIRPSG